MPCATTLIHAFQTPDMSKGTEKWNHFFLLLPLVAAVDETLGAREFDGEDVLLPTPDLTFLIGLFCKRKSA